MLPSTQYMLGFAPSGFHRVAYSDWGDPGNPNVLLCVHGVPRNRHDFDVLAQALCREYRVICIDLPGRGNSDWLLATEDYNFFQYAQDINALLCHLRVRRCHWLGSSLGGILGIGVAGTPHHPIQKLIANDSGHTFDPAWLSKMALVVQKTYEFNSFQSFKNWFKLINGGFGPLTAEQWDYLAHHSARQNGAGYYQLNVDPKAVYAETSDPTGSALPYWQRVRCPTLLIRGALSDVLSREMFLGMCEEPHVRGVEIPETGHTPMLMGADQIELIRGFLAE